jgi:hypothetical protein
LAAGASYTFGKTISTPNVTAAGAYYLIFRADSYTDQGEINEDNNSLAIPITIDLQGPDLQITSASAPASASIGSPLNVSWTVRNNGTRPAENAWWDAIYLSSDSNYDYSDAYIEGFYRADNHSPLATGFSYTFDRTIITPNNTEPGQYYLIFRTDYAGYPSLGETNETNNTLAIPLTLTNGVTPLPVVNLSVSPASGVAEDGSSNLTYTFSRSGSTSSALTVNYTIAGSASQGIDYSGSSHWTTDIPVQTITFGIGSSTATIVVDPIADGAIEPDETVVLTLASGSGYTIDTPLSATGVILNDDFPLVSVAVSPNLGVLEDSSGNLIYTFSRTGSTANSLTVSFNVGGSASPSDYTLQGASSFTGTTGFLTFASGASTATVTIDPSIDPVPEPDETLTLTLALGVGYAIGTQGAATGILRNDDTRIESQGSTSLLRRGDGLPFVEVGSTRQQVTAPWGATAGGPTETWQMLAAETLGGVNKILFRNNTNHFLHIWNLNANWNWTSSSGSDGLNTPAAFNLESAFQVDANGDGLIGSPFSTLDSQGNTTLLRRNDGLPFVEVGSTRQQVTAPWGATAGGPTETWQMLAAETLGGVNKILFRNNTNNFLHTWNLNANWNWTSSSGSDGLNTPAAFNIESAFQVDANGDGLIGSPYTTLDSQGNTTLLRRNDGLAFVEVGSTRQQVTAPWGATAGGPTETWQMLAAETLGGVNKILFRNNSANFLHTWTLDASWSWQASSGAIDPSSSQGQSLIAQFQI